MGNLHVNFTILVHSPTNIASLFYPVSKFSYFRICDTPLNCYYFTHQSYPFAHLTSFCRITKFTTVYGSSLIELPSAPTEAVCSPHKKYLLQYLYWNRLSTIKLSKNRMHRVLELELEQTNNDCAMF